MPHPRLQPGLLSEQVLVLRETGYETEQVARIIQNISNYGATFHGGRHSFSGSAFGSGDIHNRTTIASEYAAVAAHLSEPFEERDENGTLYRIGTLHGSRRHRRVALVQVGPGNVDAGVSLERARTAFSSEVSLFLASPKNPDSRWSLVGDDSLRRPFRLQKDHGPGDTEETWKIRWIGTFLRSRWETCLKNSEFLGSPRGECGGQLRQIRAAQTALDAHHTFCEGHILPPGVGSEFVLFEQRSRVQDLTFETAELEDIPLGVRFPGTDQVSVLSKVEKVYFGFPDDGTVPNVEHRQGSTGRQTDRHIVSHGPEEMQSLLFGLPTPHLFAGLHVQSSYHLRRDHGADSAVRHSDNHGLIHRVHALMRDLSIGLALTRQSLGLLPPRLTCLQSRDRHQVLRAADESPSILVDQPWFPVLRRRIELCQQLTGLRIEEKGLVRRLRFLLPMDKQN